MDEQSQDDWLPCNIASRVETPIPHTALHLVSFNVRYSESLEDGSTREHSEDGVKSDRLRLLASADGAVLGLPEVTSDSDPADAQQSLIRLRDSNTGAGLADRQLALHSVSILMVTMRSSLGIGMWQTVSVREVDEEEQLLEYMHSEQARNSMLSSADGPGSGVGDRSRDKTSVRCRNQADSEHDVFQHMQSIGDREEDNHSALSAFDPYGRHLQVYKGIKLYEDSARKEQVRR